MREHSQNRSVNGWRELYLAAIFEVDAAKLSKRIDEAENAMILRARELFSSAGDHIEEEDALDDALYALQALRNTYECCRQSPPAAA